MISLHDTWFAIVAGACVACSGPARDSVVQSGQEQAIVIDASSLYQQLTAPMQKGLNGVMVPRATAVAQVGQLSFADLSERILSSATTAPLSIDGVSIPALNIDAVRGIASIGAKYSNLQAAGIEQGLTFSESDFKTAIRQFNGASLGLDASSGQERTSSYRDSGTGDFVVGSIAAGYGIGCLLGAAEQTACRLAAAVAAGYGVGNMVAGVWKGITSFRARTSAAPAATEGND